MGDLISVREAQQEILGRSRPLAAERVAVTRADGRALAEAARARVDLPPCASSAMEGSAVRADDARAGAELRVVGEAAAGRPSERPLGSGEAIAISTGGVVPDGADAVAPVEIVEARGDTVVGRGPIEPGANVRERGGDIHAGDDVLAAGMHLGPAQIGALAAAGIAEVSCGSRPRVAIVVTGSELRRPGETLALGEIYESNGPLLEALVRRAGGDPWGAVVVADDARSHRNALRTAIEEADVLVTSGGASVGPHDLVRATLAELGTEEIFWRVAVKPGKPTGFGLADGRPVFVLPGNPVSVLVTFELFVRPALAALAGAADPLPRFGRGVLARAVRRNELRHEFVRASVRPDEHGVALEPLAGQESHMIVRSGRADALVSVEPGDGELAAGSPVDFLPLV